MRPPHMASYTSSGSAHAMHPEPDVYGATTDNHSSRLPHAVDGRRFSLAGVLRCADLGAELGLTPFVLTDAGEAYVLDPRAAIRDSAGRLVWDGRPLGPTTPRRGK